MKYLSLIIISMVVLVISISTLNSLRGIFVTSEEKSLAVPSFNSKTYRVSPFR